MEETMQAPAPRMRILLAVAALAAALAGCGGSGSSGFDPTFGEGLAIEQALEEGRCVEYRELAVCPSGATAPSGPNGAPGTFEPRVEARVERAELLACGTPEPGAPGAPDGDAGDCGLALALTVEGLPAGAELRLAVRLLPDGSWQVGPGIALSASDGDPAVVPATLDVRPTDAAVDAVQVAVLVLAPPAPDPPSEVRELADSGATWAYVLPALAVGG